MTGLGIVTFITLFGAYPLVDSPASRINELGIDSYEPLNSDRQLNLTNANVYFLQKELKTIGLTLKLGATLSRATGHITQLEEIDGTGFLRSQQYDSPAWGIGPSIEARFKVFESSRARLTMDLSASGMLYDREFPAGGLRYNGMFQIGPTMDVTFGKGHTLSVGAKWLHLSNGHGLTPRNPSFEGSGITVRYQIPI